MKAVWKMEFRRLFHNKGLYFSLAVGVILVVWLFIKEVVTLQEFEEQYALYGDKIQGYLHYPKTLYSSGWSMMACHRLFYICCSH